MTRATARVWTAWLLLPAAALAATLLSAQTAVRLTATVVPTTGQPAVHTLAVTGSGFPAGTIPPGNVTLTFQPTTPGAGPSASGAAAGVATIMGTTRRVFFRIPAAIAVTTPTPYVISMAGQTAAGVSFSSSNAAALTVNPPSEITQLEPRSARPGESVSVAITTRYTDFTQGATMAAWGPGISVGGGPEGGFGFVAVTSPTTAVAAVTVDQTAVPGPRLVRVATGVQEASLDQVFSVPTPVPPNHPPTAIPGGPYTGVTGQSIAFSGAGSSDADGDALTYAWDFGDGALGSGGAPSHTYASAGSFTVRLTVDDGRGGTHAATTVATVVRTNLAPTAQPGGPYTGVTGQPIAFSGAASSDADGDALTYAWDFGDGALGSGGAPSHTYASAGSFTVRLTVDDGRGGTHAATTVATVVRTNLAPTAQPGGPYAADAGSTIAFDGTRSLDPDGDALAFAWDFGDSAAGTGATPRHAYSAQGSYTVTLTVDDGRGARHTATAVVVVRSVNQRPAANVGGPYSGQAGGMIAFDGGGSMDPDGDLLAFAWTFGDATTGSGVAPTHAYATPGTFTVSVTVADGRGGTDTMSTQVLVRGSNAAPTARAGGPYAGEAGIAVQFDASGSTDPDADVLTYAWSFGDGGSATGSRPRRIYSLPGVYTATLVVDDGSGGTHSSSAQVTVAPAVPAVNRPPVASVGGPYRGEAGLPVSFDGAASSDPDSGDSVVLSWNFGDGATGSGPNPSHVYASAGTFDVSLTATDSHGAAATTNTSVTIVPAADRAPPFVELIGTREVLPGTLVTLTAQATDNVGVASVAFDVGGAPSSEVTAPPYRRVVEVPAVATPGTTIVVRATARDTSGNSATAEATLVIRVQPDIQNPTVTLNMPAQAAPGTTLRVSATASDNAGVSAVTFSVNGRPITIDTEPPYEASYPIPADAAPGSSFAVAAGAEDYAGNRAEARGSFLVAGAADTQPPTVALTTDAEVRPGGTLHLSAAVADNGGIAAVAFVVGGVRVGTATSAPYEVRYVVPRGAIVGSRLRCEARAVDFANLEGVAVSDVRVISFGSGDGIVAGAVYNDVTGLPLGGASVALVGTDDAGSAYAETAVTDSRGRYFVRAGAGQGVLHIGAAGFTRVDRLLTVVAGRASTVFDARLTPLAVRQAVSPSLGTLVATDGAELVVPAGGVAAPAELAVRPVSQQGLQGLLPPGWAPVAVVDIDPPGVTFQSPASLAIPNRELVPPGTALTFAVWDRQAGGWRALGPSPVNDASRLTATVGGSGQYAWLLPDVLPERPAQPVPGELLAGVGTLAVSDAATAVITPAPRVLFYRPDARSQVAGTVTTASPLASGTPLAATITEAYEFQSGERIDPDPFTQHLVFFQAPGDPSRLTGTYPVSPSMAFDAVMLRRGVITVVLSTHADGSRVGLVGPNGGEVSGANGEVVQIAAGAVGATLPVAVASIDQADLGVQLPAGLELVAALSVSFGGESLTVPAMMSVPRPAVLPVSSQILLARVQVIQGQTRLVFVGIGTITDSRIASATVLPRNQTPLEGIRIGGRYLFLRATSPVGFVAGGVLAASGGPAAGALVGNPLGIASLSGADGRYATPAAVGLATLTAIDLAGNDTGMGLTTIAGLADEVALDLRLRSQPPRVVSVTPADGSANVPLGTAVVVVFSEPIDPAAVAGPGAGSIVVASADGTPVPGRVTLSANDTTVTFRPTSLLLSDTVYTITISPTIRDRSGEALPAPFVVRFASLDTSPPPPPPAGSITASVPGTDGSTTIVASQGTASPRDTVTIENVTTGTVVPVLVETNGGFRASVMAALSDTLRIHLVDSAGNETAVALPRFGQSNANGGVSAAVGPGGGHIDAPGDVAADVPPGTFTGTEVATIRALDATDIRMRVFERVTQAFTFAGGIELDLGGASPARYLNLSVAATAVDTAQDQWVVAAVVDVNGQPEINVVDTARLVNGRITTSSPPCPGVTAAGAYGFLKSTQPVGVNYAAMRSRSGRLTAHWDVAGGPLSAFHSITTAPSLGLTYQESRPQPACFPVLSGRVTIAPNSVGISIAAGQLTPADREIVVRNVSRNLESSTPRDVMNPAFTVPGNDWDSFQVTARGPAGDVAVAGVSVSAAAPGLVTIRVNPDLVAVSVNEFVVLNLFTNVETVIPQNPQGLTISADGGAGDTYVVTVRDAQGRLRTIEQTVQAPSIGAGNLVVRAQPGTIDPASAENGAGVTRVHISDETQPREIDVPAGSIESGGFALAFDGDPTHQYRLFVTYADGKIATTEIPRFHITVSNPASGRVVRTLVGQAPPRGERLNLGIISDDVEPPFLTASPSRLNSFDPAGSLSFTFSEAMDAQSLSDGFIVTDRQGRRVAGDVRMSADNRIATFVPHTTLRLGEEYSITLVGNDALGELLEPGAGTGVRDLAGNALPTIRLTLKTFTPRRTSLLPLDKPLRDVAIRRTRVGGGQLRTSLVALADVKATIQAPPTLPIDASDLRTLDLTDAEHPIQVGVLPNLRPYQQRIALLADVQLPLAAENACAGGRAFAGDLAITTSYGDQAGISALTFLNVTDAAAPCKLGEKILTVSPVWNAGSGLPGVLPVLGFAKGVAALAGPSGVTAYAAVEGVGVMTADVARSIPGGPAGRVVEGLAAGNYVDLATVGAFVLAVDATNATLDVFDANLAALASLRLPDRPRRIVAADGVAVDLDDSGTIESAEILNLAFIGGDTSIQIVNVTNVRFPQILGSIPTPAIIRELDFDLERRVLFAGSGPQRWESGLSPTVVSTTPAFYMIDVSKPQATGLADDDGDGLDDRIFWSTLYPQGLFGLRIDKERGLAYVGHPSGLDTWAVYENCCDLGVDLAAKRTDGSDGDRDRGLLLAREKQALQQEIAAGLREAEACPVPVARLSIIEQGSGACIWTGRCGRNYQPGVSDHDFEVFFPAGVTDPSRSCAINALNRRFLDATGVPKDITLPNGTTIRFEDITFFPVSMEEFEAARLNLEPPRGSGSDLTGDLGLGRQQLLLKWLLEGEYVTVPGFSLTGQDLETILNTLRTTTGIPRLEGFEWANLQEFNLAKSKAFVRFKGASDAGSAFNKQFHKQLHDAAKAAIRATLALMVADSQANRLALDVSRASFRGNRCIVIDPRLPNPNDWRSKPCESFEEYVASAAARTLSGPNPLAMFTRQQVVDEIRRFYRVKADEETISTEPDANAFIAVTARFIAGAKTATAAAYALTLPTDPIDDADRRRQRLSNMATVVEKTQHALDEAMIQVVPHVFSRGFRVAPGVKASMWLPQAESGPQKSVALDLAGGDDLFLAWERDQTGAVVIVNGRPKAMFEIGPVNQRADVGQPRTVTFTIDLPDKSVKEANRRNNVGGVYYYTLDLLNPTVPVSPDQPPLPMPDPDGRMLDPDPDCGDPPALGVTQAAVVGGRAEQGVVFAGLGETLTLEITVTNLSTAPLRGGIACSNLTNICYTVDPLDPGQTWRKTVSFTVPRSGVIVDSTVTAVSPGAGVHTAGPLRIVASCAPLAIVPLDHDPNPPVSVVQQGGTALRYYRVVNRRTGEPAAGVPVRVAVGSTTYVFSTDGNGLIGTAEQPGIAIPLGDAPPGTVLAATVPEVDGLSAGCGEATTFTINVVERTFSRGLKGGSRIALEGALATGDINGKKGFGVEFTLDGTPAGDDSLRVSRQTSGAVGVGLKAEGLDVKFPGVSVAKLGAEAGVTGLLMLQDQHRFPVPLAEEHELAVVRLLLAGLAAEASGWLGGPPVAAIVAAIGDRIVGLEPYRTSVGASAGLEIAAGAQAKGASLSVSNTNLATPSDPGLVLGAESSGSAALIYGLDFFPALAPPELKTAAEYRSSFNLKAAIQDETQPVEKLKTLLDGTGGFAGTVKFAVFVDMNAVRLKRIVISISQQKRFGFKLVGQNLVNSGDGKVHTMALTIEDRDPAKLQDAFERVTIINALGAFLATPVGGLLTVIVSPQRIADELVALVKLADRYEETVESGNGVELDLPLGAFIAGTGLSAGATLRLDNSVAYTVEEGVIAGGAAFPLARHPVNDPLIPAGLGQQTIDTIRSALDTVKRGMNSYISVLSTPIATGAGALRTLIGYAFAPAAGGPPDDERSGAGGPSTPDSPGGRPAQAQATAGVSLLVDGAAEPVGPLTIELLAFRYRPVQGPALARIPDPSAVTGPGDRPHYGIGGFFGFAPDGRSLAAPARLTIRYLDSEVTALDESSLAIYVWNESRRDWDHVGGTVDEANNTVSVDIDRLGLYTAAPSMPAGPIAFAVETAVAGGAGDPATSLTLTSDPIRLNTGALVPDGTLFTVQTVLGQASQLVPFGQVLSVDEDPATEGIQVSSRNGVIQFAAEVPGSAGVVTALAYSIRGTAFATQSIAYQR